MSPKCQIVLAMLAGITLGAAAVLLSLAEAGHRR
jgi:hypothetical protein